MKNALILFISLLNFFYVSGQIEPESIINVPEYRGKIKPVLISDSTRIKVSEMKPVFPKQISPKFRYQEKDHEEDDEKLPADIQQKLDEMQKRKALINKKKKKLKNQEKEEGESHSNYLIQDQNAGCPPDNTVAVSRNGFIVAADNSQIGFYSIEGNELNEFSYPDFLNPVRAGLGDETADPKVIYDFESNRFVFFVQIFTSDPDKSECVLAFSMDEDPRNGWFVYVFHHFRDKKRRSFDYPGLSYNEKEVFLTGNLIKENSGNVIFQFDKSDGYNGRSMNGLMWLDIKQAEDDRTASTLFPMLTIPNRFFVRDMLFTSIQSGGGSHAYYYRINNRINNNPELKKYRINIPDYLPPTNVDQSNTTDQLNAGFVKIRGGLFLDDFMYFVFTKPDNDGFNGIALTRIKVTNFDVKTKFFHDNQNSEYTYPNISHRGRNKESHQLLLVYQRSGINHLPQIRVRKIKSNMSADGGSTTLQSSENSRRECGTRGARWGDYIGIQRELGKNTFWIAGHTASANRRWRSHLIKLNL